MANNAVVLTSGNDTTNGTVYTTASFTPTANSALFACVYGSAPSGGTTGTPSLSADTGTTWELTRQVPSTDAIRTLHVFRMDSGATPASRQLTFTFPNTMASVCWAVYEVQGAELGVSALQSIESKLNGQLGVNAPFDNPVDPANAVIAFIGTISPGTVTPGAGWVQGAPLIEATSPNNSLYLMHDNTAQQNVVANWTTSSNTWIAAIEVKTASGAPADTTAPTVPTGVTATVNSANQVTVTWNASTDAVGVKEYQVKRGGTVVATVPVASARSFVDASVVAGTTYSYTVNAVDAVGNRSSDSSAASASTPAAPTGSGNITRVGANGAWSGSGPITQVNPSGTASGDWLVTRVQTGNSGEIIPPSGWNLIDDTVDPDAGDHHYLFTRRADGTALDTPTWNSTVANDDIGYLVWSARGVDWAAPVNAFSKSADKLLTTTAPVMSTTAANCLVLNWIGDDAGSTDNIDPRFTPNDTTNWTDSLSIGLSVDWQSLHTAYRVQTTAGSVPGLTWTQHMGATVTQNGYVNHQIALKPAPSAADTTAPTVPTNVQAVAGGPTSVTVSWTASTDAVGVASYRVRRGGVDVTGATAVTGTSFVDNTVSASTAYSYTVSAVDAAGNRSAESTAANVTTPAAPDTTAPTVPTNVQAVANSASSVTVSWTASTDAVGVASYRVRRGGVDVTGATAVVGTSFTDTSVSGSTTYSYTVSAVDGAGNRSAESTAAGVTTPAAATAPVVGAGVDSSVQVNTAFSRTATENNGGATITSRAWTITAGPTGVGTTIGTAAALSWTPTQTGTYTLRYSATNSVGTGTDDVVVTVTAVPATLTSKWVGAVTDGSITVAVRTANAGSVRLAVSTSSSMTSPVYSSTATPDSNGNCKVTVSGLAADTTYTYAIEMNGVLDSGRPTARTFPTAGVATNFNFAFGSCTNSTDSDAFTRILAKNPDLFIHLGDFRYLNPFANDVTLFQGMYNEALAAANEKQLYEKIPTAYIWSDHDYAGGSNGWSGGAPKPAAQATYRQYVPHYTLPATDGGIYQTFVVGRVRFILTDLRSYRSTYSATDDATKTAMGAVQKQWFKDTIANSSEKVIIWGSELPWNDPTHTTQDDKWGAYNTERQELATFIAASGKKVIVISGDLHSLNADDGTNTAGGLPNWVAAPFTNSTGTNTATWSEGTVADAGTQRYYGWVDVTDNGSTITVTYTGYDTSNVARLTDSVAVSTVPTLDDMRAGGSVVSLKAGSSSVSKVYAGTTQVYP